MPVARDIYYHDPLSQLLFSICSSDLPVLSQPLRKQTPNQIKHRFLSLPPAEKLQHLILLWGFLSPLTLPVPTSPPPSLSEYFLRGRSLPKMNWSDSNIFPSWYSLRCHSTRQVGRLILQKSMRIYSFDMILGTDSPIDDWSTPLVSITDFMSTFTQCSKSFPVESAVLSCGHRAPCVYTCSATHRNVTQWTCELSVSPPDVSSLSPFWDCVLYIIIPRYYTWHLAGVQKVFIEWVNKEINDDQPALVR